MWFKALGCLLVSAALASGAGAIDVLLYPVTIELHFADAKGKDHVLSTSMNVEDQEQCAADMGAFMANMLAAERRPDLAAMTYTRTTCRSAKGAPYKYSVPVYSGPEAKGPALILMKFKTASGGFQNVVLGNRVPVPYQVGTCPAVLAKAQAGLIADAKKSMPNSTFVSAKCVPFTRSVTELLRSN